MKRSANDAGVVESAKHQQPPLICLLAGATAWLDAAQICPLLSKAGNYRMLSCLKAGYSCTANPTRFRDGWARVVLGTTSLGAGRFPRLGGQLQQR